ncbi:hypothetical protein DMH04_17780 [Kibdelosporangium aridum]|uniref:ATP synthase F subunit n=1 Tax=Kibdelosporangium aridum TaxID=2030 RepID=A0A428ZAP7_KIBAR|nr:hypothetical protein [Kibdelosporangium aridum]RSM85153.1 hypothetical protein DMH04_17780 [Kibdelosporangium aridum]
MGSLVAIGESVRVRGFGLAGVIVMAAEDPAAVREAWRAVPDDAEVVILTPAAAAALADRPETPLTAVLPGGAP